MTQPPWKCVNTTQKERKSCQMEQGIRNMNMKWRMHENTQAKSWRLLGEGMFDPPGASGLLDWSDNGTVWHFPILYTHFLRNTASLSSAFIPTYCSLIRRCFFWEDVSDTDTWLEYYICKIKMRQSVRTRESWVYLSFGLIELSVWLFVHGTSSNEGPCVSWTYSWSILTRDADFFFEWTSRRFWLYSALLWSDIWTHQFGSLFRFCSHESSPAWFAFTWI